VDEKQFAAALNDRLLRYGATPLDPARTITITADRAYLGTYDGQVAALVACNLLARLSPNVVVGFEDIQLAKDLPWAGRSLHGVAIAGMNALNPFGHYRAAQLEQEHFRFHLGRDGAPVVVFGSDWNAYVGPGPAPFAASSISNGIGAALSVIVAAAGLFRSRLQGFGELFLGNSWNWTHSVSAENRSPVGVACGHIMTAGAGSVGSAANYFTTLATRDFVATLIDHDDVKIHNLTRSPVFTNDDVGKKKVRSLQSFLHDAGVIDVFVDDVPLHESRLWVDRPIGTPDILIAAANEFNVRYHIEMLFPPIQLYATTGRNWQTTLLRHTPGAPACSLCVFPPRQQFAPTGCASDVSGASRATKEAEHLPDAALPFLSFAAGLMTAAEILKLGMAGYPFAAERVSLNLKGEPLLFGTPISHRPGCLCEQRNIVVHRNTIAGSGYAHLSGHQ
jgi:hypothetical protein